MNFDCAITVFVQCMSIYQEEEEEEREEKGRPMEFQSRNHHKEQEGRVLYPLLPCLQEVSIGVKLPLRGNRERERGVWRSDVRMKNSSLQFMHSLATLTGERVRRRQRLILHLDIPSLEGTMGTVMSYSWEQSRLASKTQALNVADLCHLQGGGARREEERRNSHGKREKGGRAYAKHCYLASIVFFLPKLDIGRQY